MEVKAKKCKGIGKAKEFGCGIETKFRKFGLCPKCLYSWATLTEEGKAWFNKNKLQKQKKADLQKDREKKASDKKIKDSLKSISGLIAEVKPVFQKYIRLRDVNLACISCQTVDAEIWDGGHFYKAEIYTGLIFNENNCHKQCRKCNSYLGGNENGYRIGLIARFGTAFVRRLDDMSNLLRNYKFGREELADIKVKYQLKIKEILKNGN